MTIITPSEKRETLTSRGAVQLRCFYKATHEQLAQYYDDSPDKLRALSRQDTLNLLMSGKATVEQLALYYDKSPDKLRAMLHKHTLEMVKECNVTIEQLAQYYDDSPEKFRVLSNARKEIKDDTLTAEQAAQYYDDSPEKLRALLSYDTYRLRKQCNLTIEQTAQYYDQSPEKLKALSNSKTLALLKEYNVTLRQAEALYTIDPSQLSTIGISYAHKTTPQNQVLSIIEQAIRPYLDSEQAWLNAHPSLPSLQEIALRQCISPSVKSSFKKTLENTVIQGVYEQYIPASNTKNKNYLSLDAKIHVHNFDRSWQEERKQQHAASFQPALNEIKQHQSFSERVAAPVTAASPIRGG